MRDLTSSSSPVSAQMQASQADQDQAASMSQAQEWALGVALGNTG